MAHTPAGASSKQFAHYGQEHLSRKFRKYDYGWIGNLANYGGNPPKYPLKNIVAPVALHYSSNDWMAEPVDVTQLHKELGNPIGKFKVSHPKFNHLDYLWGIDAKRYVYDRVINMMWTYN